MTKLDQWLQSRTIEQLRYLAESYRKMFGSSPHGKSIREAVAAEIKRRQG